MFHEPDCLLKWNNYQRGWVESNGYCLPWLQEVFWYCLSQCPHRQIQEVWTRWIDSKVDWDLLWTEQQIPESSDSGSGRLVTSGVPQGSVLSPAWFTSLLNDLEEGTDASSTSSLMTQSWEEWAILQSAGQPFSIASRLGDTILSSYSALVRPQSAVPISGPLSARDMVLLDWVQQRATKTEGTGTPHLWRNTEGAGSVQSQEKTTERGSHHCL